MAPWQGRPRGSGAAQAWPARDGEGRYEGAAIAAGSGRHWIVEWARNDGCFATRRWWGDRYLLLEEEESHVTAEMRGTVSVCYACLESL